MSQMVVTPTRPTLSSMRSRIDNARSSVTEYEAITDEEAKKNKEKEIIREVQEIEHSLESLEESIQKEKESASFSEIARINEMKEQFEEVKALFSQLRGQLDALSIDISQNIEEEDDEEDANEEDNEDKSWFSKQVEWLFSGEEWKENTWTNIARAASWVWIVYGAKKLWNWAFWWGEEKEKSSKDSDEKKKSWFSRTFWAVWRGLLWWWGIIAWAMGLKWLFDKYAKGWSPANPKAPEVKDLNEEKVEKYWNILTPEQREEFESYWGVINGMYNNIFKDEIEDWWENDNELWSIWEDVDRESWRIDVRVPKWLVVATLDNSFSSVDKLVSEEAIFYMRYQDDITFIEKTVLWWIGDTTGIWGALKSFVSTLDSFIPFYDGSNWSESVWKWFENNPKEAKASMQVFFRQYTKVLTYLVDKQNQLQIEIAKKAYENNPWEFKTFEDAFENQYWFETNVEENKDYKAYLSWTIKNSKSILQKYKIHNEQLSKYDGWWLQWLVDWLNEERNTIMGIDKDNDKDLLDDALAQEELDQGTLGDIETSVDSLKNTINDNLEESFFYWVFSSVYHETFNSNFANTRAYIENTLTNKTIPILTAQCDDFTKKIEEGTFTKDDLKQYKKFANDTLAFKKECMVGWHTMQHARGENTDYMARFWIIAWWLVGLVDNCTKNVVDWVSEWWWKWWTKVVASLWLGYWATYPFIKLSQWVTWPWNKLPVLRPIHKGMKNLAAPWDVLVRWVWWIAWKAWKIGGRQWIKKVKNWFLLRNYVYNWKAWPELLIKDIVKGKISPSVAEKVFTKKQLYYWWERMAVQFWWKEYNDLPDLFVKKFGMPRPDAKLLFEGSTNSPAYIKNTSVAEKLFTVRKKSRFGMGYEIIYEYQNVTDGSEKPIIQKLNKFDAQIRSISETNKKQLIVELYQRMDFDGKHSLDDLGKLVNQVDDINMRYLPDDTNIKQLAKKLLTDSDNLLDTNNPINKKVLKLNDAWDLAKLSDIEVSQKKLLNQFKNQIAELDTKINRASGLSQAWLKQRQWSLKSIVYQLDSKALTLWSSEGKGFIKGLERLMDSNINTNQLVKLANNMDDDLIKILKQGNKRQFTSWINAKRIRWIDDTTELFTKLKGLRKIDDYALWLSDFWRLIAAAWDLWNTRFRDIVETVIRSLR